MNRLTKAIHNKIYFIIITLLIAFSSNNTSFANWEDFDSPSFLTAFGETQDGRNIRQAGDYFQYITNAYAASIILYKRDFIGLGQYALTFGASSGTMALLKEAVNRTRPSGGNLSFPSGHAQAVFAPAFFLYYRYGSEYALPAFAMATFTGLSRIIANQHYITDVLGSVAISWAFARLFTRSFMEERLLISPSVGLGGGNIGIQYVW